MILKLKEKKIIFDKLNQTHRSNSRELKKIKNFHNNFLF